MGGLRRWGCPGLLRRLGIRRAVAPAVAVSLLAGAALLAGAVPALLTQHSAALPQGPSVLGTQGMSYPARHVAPDVPAAVSAHSWPAARTAAADLAAVLPVRLAGRAAQGYAVDRVTVPGTPVFVQPASVAGRGPTGVAVTVAAHALSQRLGVTGVVVSVGARQGSGKVTVGLDYRSFAGAYGGNFGSRLRLVELPACALTTPQARKCQQQTPIPAAVNWAGEQAAVATVSLPASGAATVLAATTTYKTGNADGGSDGGGAAGSYAATTLKPSGSWTAGGSTGDFTYSYPITVPPAPSAMAPSLSLSYDSGSLDGQTAATQAQAGWLGDGWSTPDNFVEQSYVPCSDSPEGAAAATPTSDECYDGQVLSLSLNGMSTAIVYDSASGKYVLQDDNGDTVAKVTGSGNGSGTYDTSYWVITDRSGTSYYFGRNELPGWAPGDPATNSVDSEPVFSGHDPTAAPPPGVPAYTDPCWKASVCTMAYRWHLDYVTDAHGNAMAWYYHQDTNAYLQNAASSYATEPDANATYVRDSYPIRIDYGFTAGNAYSADGGHAPDQVLFEVDDSAPSGGVNGGSAYGRCDTANGACAAMTAGNAGSAPYIYPDVPYDLNCAIGGACLVSGPSFWSTAQLAGITTQQWNGTAYAAVDNWSFAQSFPATGDGTSPTLFLASILHTGEDTTAGGAAGSLKKVIFSDPPTAMLGNRVNPTNAFPEMTRQRIGTITTETGSVITVKYELASACTSADQANPAANTGSCYPVWWTPQACRPRRRTGSTGTRSPGSPSRTPSAGTRPCTPATPTPAAPRGTTTTTRW